MVPVACVDLGEAARDRAAPVLVTRLTRTTSRRSLMNCAPFLQAASLAPSAATRFRPMMRRRLTTAAIASKPVAVSIHDAGSGAKETVSARSTLLGSGNGFGGAVDNTLLGTSAPM